MPSWNVKLLEARRQVLKIDKIINEKPDFVIVQLSNGKQQKLCDSNFPEWRKVKEGRKIELIIQESVIAAKLLLGDFKKKVQESLNDLQKRIGGLFFMWVCEYCETAGHITYDDGDEPQGIAERIDAAHKKEAMTGCDKTKLTIYDHRGMPQKNSSLIMSFRKIK